MVLCMFYAFWLMVVYRQGDVLLRRVRRRAWPPSGERLDGFVLQGETGNLHRVSGRHSVYRDGEGLLLVAGEGCVMEHDEHRPLKIPPGVYRVYRVVEFDREKALDDMPATREVVE